MVKVILLLLILIVNIQIIKSDDCIPCFANSQICVPDEGPCVDVTKACLNNGTSNTCLPRTAVDAPCNSDIECTFGNSCVEKICQGASYLGVNEKCTKSFQCTEGLTCENGKCYTPTCTSGTPTCPFNQYCDSNQQCKAMVGLNGTCGSEISCQQGLICSVNNVCTKIFSVGQGGSCTDNYDCDFKQSLYCDSEEQTCESSTLTSPTLNCLQGPAVCKEDIEYCDCSGKCQPLMNANAKCATSATQMYDCLAKYQCPQVENINNKNSCAVQNCPNQYCAFVTDCIPGPCGIAPQVACQMANEVSTASSTISSCLFITSLILSILSIL